ncbi:MAG: diguanylate cyclase [Pseudomonadota bacterium]
MEAELLNDIVEWAGEVASIGYWSYDPETGQVTWSDQAAKLLGLPPDAVTASNESFFQVFSDNEAVSPDGGFDDCLSQDAPFVVERNIQTAGSGERRVRVIGRKRAASDTMSERLVGIVQDTSQEHARQQSLGTALRWLETASEIASLGYWYLDVTNQNLEWSDEVFRIHGYEPGAFIPELENAIDAYHPEDRERITAAVQRGQETGEPWALHARLVQRDGSIRQVMARGKPLYESGRLMALFGVLQDITDQEQRLANERLFVSLVQQTPEGICITDVNGHCEWVNEAFEMLTGFSANEMHGQKPGQLLQGPETDPETVARIAQALEARQPYSCEILNYRRDGLPYWTRLSIFPHFDEHGELTHYMSIQIDVTEQRKAEEKLAEQTRSLELSNFQLSRQRTTAEIIAKQDREIREELETAVERSRELQDELRRLAHFDELTGLPNRRHVLERAEAELRRSVRYGRPLSIVITDIDHFKQINDGYGHQVGDEAIRHVSALLAQSLREEIDMCGRIGGEEFLLLLPESEVTAAALLAERLRKLIEESPLRCGAQFTCSFGVAERDTHETLEGLIKAADSKLYEAKNGGRNCVHF